MSAMSQTLQVGTLKTQVLHSMKFLMQHLVSLPKEILHRMAYIKHPQSVPEVFISKAMSSSSDQTSTVINNIPRL